MHAHGHAHAWKIACSLIRLRTFALQLGGMGFVHYNNTVEQQVKHVQKCKTHIPGMVVTPMVMKVCGSCSALNSSGHQMWVDSVRHVS